MIEEENNKEVIPSKETPIQQEDLAEVLRQNIELNQQILRSCQKTEKHMFNIKVFGFIKFLIIFLPIVIGIFYLVPILSDFIDIYKKMLGGDILESIKNLNELNLNLKK